MEISTFEVQMKYDMTKLDKKSDTATCSGQGER